MCGYNCLLFLLKIFGIDLLFWYVLMVIIYCFVCFVMILVFWFNYWVFEFELFWLSQIELLMGYMFSGDFYCLIWLKFLDCDSVVDFVEWQDWYYVVCEDVGGVWMVNFWVGEMCYWLYRGVDVLGVFWVLFCFDCCFLRGVQYESMVDLFISDRESFDLVFEVLFEFFFVFDFLVWMGVIIVRKMM